MPKKRPSPRNGLCGSAGRFLVEQRRNHLLDDQRARIDSVEITVVVIIMVVRIQVVAPSDIVRNVAVGVIGPIAALPVLTAIELLRLSGRQAAIVFLGEARRAALVV